MHTSSSILHQGRAFRLTNESEKWGYQVWSLLFDLQGEKVNKLDAGVLEEFGQLLPKLEELGKAGQIDALVLHSGKNKNFIAGADIKLIQGAKTPKDAQELSSRGHQFFNRWEDLPYPTIVAIDGSALGGGCEWSLASTAIVMSNSSSAQIGLPEVLLGIIPGLGGCVRMPQRVGIATALDLILTGKSLKGDRAFKVSLADACVQKDNFMENVHFWIKAQLPKLRAKAKDKTVQLGKPPKLGGMGGLGGKLLEGMPMGRNLIFKKAKEGVMKKTFGHYPAPLEAIEVIQSIGTRVGVHWNKITRQRALDREAAGFGKVASTAVSKNLIGLFFITEELKKANGLESGHEVPQKDLHAAGVLGAGVMGGGIAQLFANKDITIRMKDIGLKGLQMGAETASKLFAKAVKKKKLTKREFFQKMNHIAPVLDYSGFKSLDLVVEAVVEDMAIKKKVLQELEGSIRKDCVIATNTSSLSVSEMQTALSTPERFCGMHFFNPVHRMPLIEVIRGAKSSDEAVSAVFEMSKRLGKMPIVVKDAPGFLVNRLLTPYMNESAFLLGDGAPIEEIDRAMVKFGMPMGPIELIDEVGVDVGAKVVKVLNAAFGDRMPPAPLIHKVVESKRLGKKTKQGFYDYEGTGERLKKKSFPGIYSLLGVSAKAGKISPQEMVDRCILPIINEAALCLDEKIVARAADVDLGMIMGTGFAPFRGGPLRYADSLGLDAVVARLKELETKYGRRFKPCEGLENRARQKATFY